MWGKGEETITIHLSFAIGVSELLQRMKMSQLTADMSVQSGPEVIKLFSCSTQLSMKFVLLINFKLLTIANSFLLNIGEYERFSAYKYENANYCYHF